MKKIFVFFAAVLLQFFLCFSIYAKNEDVSWMRYPSISPDGKSIVFSYKGDIYKVGTEGGIAERLTSNSSHDTKPVWSPDGKKIAFVSDRYFGSKDIYVMSSDGGAAKRITTHSTTEDLFCFSPDGKSLLFGADFQDDAKSALFPSSRFKQLYSVSVEGGKRPVKLLGIPMENASLSKDGRFVLYQDLKGFENTWRKHHTSSVTRNLMVYDMKTGKSIIVDDKEGEDLYPCFSPDDKYVYFLSERSGSFNVFRKSFGKKSEKVEKLTDFKQHPVRFLSVSSNNTICFGYDGNIYVMPFGKKEKKVDVKFKTDADNEDIKQYSFTTGATESAVSPDGTQVAFVVRGEVFVTSTDYSTTKRITETVQAEKNVAFSPDGRTLYYSGDRNGGWDIYKTTIVRSEDPNFANSTILKEELLMPGIKGEKTNPKVSPDGKELAFVLDRKKLAIYNFSSGKARIITDEKFQPETYGEMVYRWSPDSKWITLEYIANHHAPYTDIGIVKADGSGKGNIFNLTGSGYFCSNPRFVMGGNAILYSSERYGMRNHASWGSMSDVMIVFLNRKAMEQFKLSPEEYELSKASKEKADTTKRDMEIEFDNIDKRHLRLTSNSSDLSDYYLTEDGSKLYYLSAFESGYDLWSVDVRKKETSLLKKLNSSNVSIETDKDSKNLFLLGSSMLKFTLPGLEMKKISYKADMTIDGYKERKTMFDVVKREEAKRFYVADMHGVDWNKLTSHYEKYLPYIDNNYDFSEMLSEMLGELNVSHTGSGYRNKSTAPLTAELGLFLSYDKNAKYPVVDEVVIGGPFDTSSSKVKKGDIIKKINGVEINNEDDYYPLLEGKVGKPVLVTFANSSGTGEWDEVIKPISGRTLNNLLYERWIMMRENEVEKLSGGKLGYVHIPSMNDESFRTMYSKVMGKYYDKEGIVIDIRYNGGGRLHEDLEVFFSASKYLTQEIRGEYYCDMPSRRWTKPSIMVVCEADYSNAHGTPWVYKTMNIGKLVGKPVPGTMTSVNWVTLQDPSLYFGIPVVGYRTAQGNFLENSQLEPDYNVTLDTEKLMNGEDTQIKKAVEVLMSHSSL